MAAYKSVELSRALLGYSDKTAFEFLKQAANRIIDTIANNVLVNKLS